jgi:hypothetical protein
MSKLIQWHPTKYATTLVRQSMRFEAKHPKKNRQACTTHSPSSDHMADFLDSSEATTCLRKSIKSYVLNNKSIEWLDSAARVHRQNATGARYPVHYPNCIRRFQNWHSLTDIRRTRPCQSPGIFQGTLFHMTTCTLAVKHQPMLRA